MQFMWGPAIAICHDACKHMLHLYMVKNGILHVINKLQDARDK